MQKRCNSSANALELHLFCIKSSSHAPVPLHAYDILHTTSAVLVPYIHMQPEDGHQ